MGSVTAYTWSYWQQLNVLNIYSNMTFGVRWYQLQGWQKTACAAPVVVANLVFQLEKVQQRQGTRRKRLQHPQLPPHLPLPVALPDG